MYIYTIRLLDLYYIYEMESSHFRYRSSKEERNVVVDNIGIIYTRGVGK